MKAMDNKGFTLIEVVIALGVLAIGIIAMFSMQTLGIKGNSSANRITETANWAADKMEEIISKKYNDPDLIDRNNNGTKQDLDKNGVDDSGGGSFGLDDTFTGTVVDADHNAATADGKYNVYWNVAVDHPARGVKTVQINVVDIATNKSFSVQFQKFDQI